MVNSNAYKRSPASQGSFTPFNELKGTENTLLSFFPFISAVRQGSGQMMPYLAQLLLLEQLRAGPGHPTTHRFSYAWITQTAIQVSNDPTQPLHPSFQLWASGRRLMFPMSRKNGYQKQFVPPLYVNSVDSRAVVLSSLILFHGGQALA